MPAGLVDSLDRCGKADRRQAPRAISGAAAASGFDAACEAAALVFESGRVPDDASVDVLARRAASGSRGGPGLAARDGFPG